MPSTTPKNKSTSLPLLIVLLIVAALGGGYYYYTTVLSVPAPAASTVPSTIPTTADWQKQIYDDPSYTRLVNPLPGPIEAGPTGNPAPFVQVQPNEARK